MAPLLGTTLIKPAISLQEQFEQVRQLTETLCTPLSTEDYGVQSMPDVSPPKWHLAHTAWFFETFLLMPNLKGYEVFHPKFGYLFNSYYEAVGDRHPRLQRGLLSRPTVAEVYQYRAYVDEAMRSLLQTTDEPALQALTTLGLHHEQQHQELLLTDIKHILACNPLRPAYRDNLSAPDRCGTQTQWLAVSGGLHTIGQEIETEIEPARNIFAFDNERPLHQVYLQDYCLASQPVTNGEYLDFIEAAGYQTPEYWLSEGWTTVQTEGWTAPLYWEKIDGNWWNMTLGGLRSLNVDEPVCHVSFFEADAYARWVGKRLPTEAEWEVAAAVMPLKGNLLEQGYFHPVPPIDPNFHPYGNVWEWTQSAYLPYPGFKADAGAVGEYNGKFMCNQMVLRGGSCITPQSHIRATYRNFFPTATRWQFSGIRLAH
jgi:ergothioneine biosynthesis protein EgtB